MFSNLNIIIKDVENTPSNILEGIRGDDHSFLTNKLHEMYEVTGIAISVPLEIIYHHRPDNRRAGYCNLLRNRSEAVEIGLNTAHLFEWERGRKRLIPTFVHEVGHGIFETGKLSSLVGRILSKSYNYHTGYRTEAFTEMFVDEHYEMEKQEDDWFLDSRYGEGHKFNPSKAQIIRCLKNRGYREILDDNLQSVKTAEEKGKTFDSFADYVKNRGKYKALQEEFRTLK